MDDPFLEQALILGRRGWGSVHPNPAVGCVLVHGDEVVGRGWHQEFGGPHAEVMALRDAGPRAKGSTAYVSLEPCAHHGKTPPCTNALLDAGVARVVYGAPDPGPQSGGGGRILNQAGVSVAGPMLDLDQARAENPSFFHWTEKHTPWVAVKLAQTLDGKIARPGEATRITGPEAERHVHLLRRGFDAILVGSGTARTDDPRLTIRHGPRPARPPIRVVVDSDGSLTPAARLFEPPLAAPIHVFVGADLSPARTAPLAAAGATVHPVTRSRRGVELDEVMALLGSLGVRSVLCEGGGTLAQSVLEAGLAERLYLYVAPWIMGPGGVDGLRAPTGREEWAGWRAMAGSQPALPHPIAGGGLGSDALLVYRRSY